MKNLQIENGSLCPRCGLQSAGDEPMNFSQSAVAVQEPEQPPFPVWIGGRYERLNRLGQGGMGAVFLAFDHWRQHPCALKLLRSELVADSLTKRRFHREAGALKALSHPHIAAYLDSGETDAGEPFLIMEYIVGVSLRSVKSHSDGKRLGVGRTLRIAVQLAEALWHAHRAGIIHRDIKPDNIMLSKHGNQPDWVMLLDLGLARIVGEKPITTFDSPRFGTVSYMAPEVIADTVEPGPGADVYSLGVLLYDLIIGEPPFLGRVNEIMEAHQTQAPQLLGQRATQRGLAEAIPAAMERLVSRMLAKDPGQRPSTQEVLDTLTAISHVLPRRSNPDLYTEETLVLLRDTMGHALYDAPTMLLPQRTKEVAENKPAVDRKGQWSLARALIKARWPDKIPLALRQLLRRSRECRRELALGRQQAQELSRQAREAQHQQRALGPNMSADLKPTLPLAELSARLGRLHAWQTERRRTLGALRHQLMVEAVRAFRADPRAPDAKLEATCRELEHLLA